MKKIHHKNVVNLREVLVSSSRLYMVMELCTGGELFEHIGNLSEPEARLIFRQLIGGVEHMHLNGIAHRDLKPENLLLDDDKNLKITDFGFATVLGNEMDHREALLTTRCGTPHYIAPEVLDTSNKGYDGKKSDVWACGVILFVLVAGYLPFEGNTHKKLYDSIMHDQLSIPETFSTDLGSLVRELLTKSPHLRPPLSEIRKHPWVTFDVGSMTDMELVKPVVVTKSEMRNAIDEVDNGRMNAFDLISMAIGPAGGAEPDDVKRTTTLYCGQSAEETFSVIKKLLLQHQLKCVMGGPDVGHIKVFDARYGNDLVNFAVHVFDLGPELSLVQFNRRKGNPLAYLNIFRVLSEVKMLKEITIPEPEDREPLTSSQYRAVHGNSPPHDEEEAVKAQTDSSSSLPPMLVSEGAPETETTTLG
jgi:5'-AMP-activated protein kinase, catalytic alpha subunit